MTIIYAATADQHLVATILPKIAQNNIDMVRLSVSFDSAWASVTAKSAVFTTSLSAKPYEVLLSSNGDCLVPYEVLVNPCKLYITIKGVTASGATKSTTRLIVKVLEGTPVVIVSDPSPSVYEQLATMNKVLEARMNTFLALPDGSTTNDARLEDICNGADGTVYNSPGEAVREQFEAITGGLYFKGSDYFIGSSQGNFPYTDVNDFPVNTTITNGYDISSWMKNLPSNDFIGVILTLCHADNSAGGGVVQIAFRNNAKVMYIRVKWNTWSEWKTTLLGDVAFGGDKALIPSYTHINNLDNSPYSSYNDFPINTIIGVTALLPDRPTDEAYGTCITLNFTANDGGGTTQLMYSRPDHALFVRNCWGGTLVWDEWQKCLTPSDLSEIQGKLNEFESDNTPHTIASFLKIGCIGDSLASGECQYTKEDGSTGLVDLYDYSWGQFMARKYGIECVNFSVGGLSTRTWLTHSKGWALAQKSENVCNAYIIGLGQNDIGKLGNDYLGTIADIDLTNYENNADTYYGNYGKIIQLVKTVQPKAKFFLLTDPVVTDFNDAIVEIAEKIPNCYCIDLTQYSNMYASNGFFGINKRGGHYNAVAYNRMADIIGNAISTYMNENPTEFIQIEFIGTDYAY